jgi:hypothetical protein
MKSIICEENNTQISESASLSEQEKKYFDNNYFWKDYEVDMDLSEL